jgi:FkbM family methyltransferase
MSAGLCLDASSRWLRLLRTLPVGLRGKSHLARFALRRWLDKKDVRIIDRFGFRYIVPSLREPIGFYLLIDGVYEADLVRLVTSQLELGGVFLDVGANIGTFTVPAATAVGPHGVVLAVEASPRMRHYLATNIELNQCGNVIQEQCVASDHEGTCHFYEAPLEQFGMGSVGPQFGVAPLILRAATLDSLAEQHHLDRVDVIKIDVEGYEAAVFRGAQDILHATNPPLIVFEFCDWAEERIPDAQIGDAQRTLYEAGFQIWRLPDYLQGRAPLKNLVTRGFETLVAKRV